MTRKRTNFRVTFAVTTVLLIAIAVFLTSVLGDFSGARVDLTSDQLFTMSPSAGKILSELKVPVQLKFYITASGEMPTELKTLERDVTDKLRDYQNASGGMLEYSIFHPQGDEDMQTSLTERGLRPFQVQSIDRDEIGVKLVWSAMTIAYKDYPEEVLPQVLPQSLSSLEYELLSRIYRLTRERNPVVAVFAPREQIDPQVAMMYMQQGMQPPEPPDRFSALPQLLGQEHYDVRRIELTRESPIPPDADILLVLNPNALNERQAWEINRALSNGLNVLLAVQNHNYNYQPGARGGFDISAMSQQSGLERVLDAAGLKVANEHYMDENLVVLSVPRTQNIGGLRFQSNEPVRLPVQVMISADQMSQETAISNRIGSLLYLWGTPVEADGAKLTENGLTATTLFTSSDRTWVEPFNEGPVAGSVFNPTGAEMIGRLPLALLVEGEFPDGFQGETLPEWPAAPAAEGQAPPPPDTAAPLDPQPARLVLIGCAKMFDDMVLQSGQHNALFLMNIVDSLVHGDDLISIRSKVMTQRSLKMVGDSHKLFYRMFVVILVPVLLIAYGVFRVGVRRKEAAIYRESLRLRR